MDSIVHSTVDGVCVTKERKYRLTGAQILNVVDGTCPKAKAFVKYVRDRTNTHRKKNKADDLIDWLFEKLL